MGSGSYGPYGSGGSGSQPYADTYGVYPSALQADKNDKEIYDPQKGYPVNPTAKEISHAIVNEHIEIAGNIPDGPITYVLNENNEIIIGKRSNPINPNKRSPHPMLVGGKDPHVQCAGMITFKKGKIVSIDNQSGHFRPNKKSMEKVYQVLKKLQGSNPKLFSNSFNWRET